MARSITHSLLSQVEFILQELRANYRQLVLDKLAAMGKEVPSGVDPLDLAIELGSDQESSDLGKPVIILEFY